MIKIFRLFDGFSFKAKMYFLLLVNLLILGALSLTAQQAIRDLDSKIHLQSDTASLLREQMMVDMMHDAVKSDVLNALYLSSGGNDASAGKAALDSFKEHQAAMNESVDQLAKSGLSNEAESALKTVKPDLLNYLASAATLIHLAFDDRSGAVARYGAFDVQFHVLEKSIAQFGDAIELNIAESAKLAAGTAQIELNKIYVVISIGVIALLYFSTVIYLAVVRPLNHAIKIARVVSSGDLTSRIDVESHDETGQLMAALADMNTSLASVVRDVRSCADLIDTGTADIAAGNRDLSSRTEQQASSLEETASAMEELTSTVKQNAENARQANQLAAGASDVAVKGGSVIRQVVDTMDGISTSSKKIADIIGVIDGIAFQTNILALNAAVEAARAGEQGRGFAVVASEVRSLAQRSAAAAKEIKELINDSAAKVDEGTAQVDQAGKTMDEIVASVKRVTDIMSEITAASQEQSAGIGQVSAAISQMDDVTQQNAALVEQAAAAAEVLGKQAQKLSETVATFKISAHNPSSVSEAQKQPSTWHQKKKSPSPDTNAYGRDTAIKISRAASSAY